MKPCNRNPPANKLWAKLYPHMRAIHCRRGALERRPTLEDSAVAALNTDIFSIFSDLQLLSDSLNTFFAGGLQDDDEASQAIQSADSIEGKTKEIRDEEE